MHVDDRLPFYVRRGICIFWYMLLLTKDPAVGTLLGLLFIFRIFMLRLLVGIDLGTTYTTCSIAQYQGDTASPYAEVLPIYQLIDDPFSMQPYGSEPILPSLVCLKNDGGLYSGRRCRTAMPELLSAGYRVIRDTKRQLANPAWFILYGRTKLRPRHVAALLLTTVRRSITKQFPNSELVKVVITIPASFSSLMRQETLRAAILAGFDPRCIELLDEPVAALLSALGQTKDDRLTSGEPLFVFDMGGGTVDATLITITDATKLIQVMATSRYHDLAGNDIDLEIAALILREVREHADYNGFLEYNERTIHGRTEAINIGLRLLSLGERTKLELGQIISQVSTLGSLETKREHFANSLVELTVNFNLDFPQGITPTLLPIPVVAFIDTLIPYISPNSSSHRDIFVPIQQVIKRANLTEKVRLFLAGGSSYFPLVQEALGSFFKQTPFMLHPVHAVSHGAVIWAHLQATNMYAIGDTLHESIFLKRKGQGFLALFNHPSPIPSKIQEQTFAEGDIFIATHGRTVRLELYQGNSSTDSQMTLCHVEMLTFDTELPADAQLMSLHSSIDADKTFHLTLGLKCDNSVISGEVAFRYGDLLSTRSRVEPNPLTGLILNGEPI
jgi:molecular chaperone DnaK (HSP70)